MAFGIGDSLSIRVTGDTDDFERSMSSAERALNSLNDNAVQTAAALALLEGRADEAADEMIDLALSTSTANQSLNQTIVSALGTQAAMQTLSQTTILTLIPALGLLATTLVPITGALAGFVTIAGAVAGTGLVSVLGAAATETDFLSRQFNELIGTLESTFAPLFFEAANVLTILMMELGAIADELAPTQAQIQSLGELFRELGVELINLLPAFVELGIALTQEFLPGFINFVEDVGPELPGILRSMVGIFEDMLPLFMAFGAALVNLLPHVNELGMTTLNTLAPALGTLNSILIDALTFFNNLSPAIQELAVAGALLAPIVSAGGLLASLLANLISILPAASTLLSGLGTAVSALSGPIGILIGLIGALAVAWRTNFGNIRTIATNTFSSIQTDLARLQPVIQGFGEFWSNILLPALTKVGGIVIDILSPALEIAATKFEFLLSAISGLISGGFDLLVDLALGFSRILAGDVPGGVDIMVQAVKDGLIGILEFAFEWGRRLTDTIVESAINAATGVIETLNQIPGVSIGQPDQLFGQVRTAVDEAQAQSRRREQRAIENIQEIEVTVEGSTDVIEDVAATVVNAESRQQRRNNGSPTGL